MRYNCIQLLDNHTIVDSEKLFKQLNDTSFKLIFKVLLNKRNSSRIPGTIMILTTTAAPIIDATEKNKTEESTTSNTNTNRKC